MNERSVRDAGGYPPAEELLARWIGLDAETIGRGSIGRAVRARMESLGVEDPGEAVDRARLDPGERDRLVEEVVVGESWFFRDPQVFDFVRRFAAARAARGPIRILSAPCAGGEEPYSLAIALVEAGVPAERFTIDALDVSRAGLDRARAARYSANAFRNADLTFRDRWFRREGSMSVLDETIRGLVGFHWANLLDDLSLAAAGVFDRGPYDVVFCRNLLIYLTAAARGGLERTLDRLVAPDGLLVLGAAEPPILKGVWIPAAESSVFALRRGPAPAAASPGSPAASSAPAVRPAAIPPSRPRPASVAEPAAPPDPPPSLEDALREAGALANAHRFGEALARCEAHARVAGPSPELFYLMGVVHQAAGDPDRAEGCFHKTLYLDASHDEALLALALSAARRGDAAMAEHYRRSATRIHDRKGAS